MGTAKIIVNGGCIFDGKEEGITVDALGRNSIFVSTSQDCRISNTDFTGFSNLIDSTEQHYLPSALTFYETNIRINNSTFNRNQGGDDYINFFRCPSVTLSQCAFNNVLADAVDSDFSKLKINDCSFNNIGNDAVDVSGSYLVVFHSEFSNVLDKAVSGGEASSIEVNSCQFTKNEIALVSKDGSVLNFNNCTFTDNNLDISAFQKKLEYNLSEVYTNDSINLTTLIEKGVKTNIRTAFSNGVKDKMYGREFGRATEK